MFSRSYLHRKTDYQDAHAHPQLEEHPVARVELLDGDEVRPEEEDGHGRADISEAKRGKVV